MDRIAAIAILLLCWLLPLALAHNVADELVAWKHARNCSLSASSPSGWDGAFCQLCASDATCGTGKDTRCDTSLRTYRRKQFECDVTSLEIASLVGSLMTMQCQTQLRNASLLECDVQAWWNAREEELVFSCHLNDCERTTNGKLGKVRYSCPSSFCSCGGRSTHCDDYVRYSVERMRNSAYVECDTATPRHGCVMHHSDFTDDFELSCRSAECTDAPADHDDEVAAPTPTIMEMILDPENVAYVLAAFSVPVTMLVSFSALLLLVIFHVRHASKAIHEGFLFVSATEQLRDTVDELELKQSQSGVALDVVEPAGAEARGFSVQLEVRNLSYSIGSSQAAKSRGWCGRAFRAFARCLSACFCCCCRSRSRRNGKTFNRRAHRYVREPGSGSGAVDAMESGRYLSPADANRQQQQQTSNGTAASRHLLRDINLTMRSGRVIALMGPSGAGKTTLLDILAGKTKSGRLGGRVLVNGCDIHQTRAYKRLVGYVYQDDLQMETLTVAENVDFSARTRLPSALVNPKERQQRVEQALRSLEIDHLRDQRVGKSDSGGGKSDSGGGADRGSAAPGRVSGGERKRVSVAMEAVVQSPILFLDEPTSGLDSRSAYNLVWHLRQMAHKHNKLVVMSIHQPPSDLYNKLIDEVILLKDGKVVTSGSKDQVRDFFVRDQKCTFPSDKNPADVLIDLLHDWDDVSQMILQDHQPQQQQHPSQSDMAEMGSERGEDSDDDPYGSAAETASDSEYHAAPAVPNPYAVQPPLPPSQFDASLSMALETRKMPILNLNAYANSFLAQLAAVNRRTVTNLVRNSELFITHFVNSLVIAFGLSTLYPRLGIDIAGTQNRLGAIFFTNLVLALTSGSTMDGLIRERPLYIRDVSNRLYRPSAYYVSKLLCEWLPLRILPAVAIAAGSYWFIGLRDGLSHFLWYVTVMTLFNVTAGAMGTAVAIASPSTGSASVIFNTLVLINSVFGGLMLNNTTVPVYYRWAKYLSFWHYAYEALLSNEFYDRTLLVNPEGLMPRYVKGQFWMREMGMNGDMFLPDISILALFGLFYTTLGYIFLHALVKERK
jgi:ABC-type multidrug transport system ATPase subunit/ABC-type multidrug transport system permease subunit